MAETKIHPSSVVSSKATIGAGVTIGPFCRVFDGVILGDDCVLESHVVLGCGAGEVVIGSGNKFSGFSVIGGPPQDLKYKNEKTKLILGDNNVVRESVTMSIGTVTGGGVTQIGSHNLIMAYCHVAHDDLVGDSNIFANGVQLAGHVTVEDKVIVGAATLVNQFVKIGRHAFLAGGCWVNKDIVPFCMAQGNYATIRGTNKIGLERAGMSDQTVQNINRAIRILTKGSDTVQNAISRIADECDKIPEIDYLVSFALSSKRGVAL